MVYLLIYVNDVLITSNKTMMVKTFVVELGNVFAIRDWVIFFFLGVDVIRTSIDLHLSYHKYIKDILQWIGMQNCKPIAFPLSKTIKLSNYIVTCFEDVTLFR